VHDIHDLARDVVVQLGPGVAPDQKNGDG
jgi:hypothetical protein